MCVGQGMDLKLQKKTERSTDKRLKLGKHRFIIDNRGGLTQERRKISEWRVLPAGCIIGEKGPAILPLNDFDPNCYWLLELSFD